MIGRLTGVWILAALVAWPDFDRDSLRRPLLLAVAVVWIAALMVRGLRRGELMLRKEPVMGIAAVAWGAAVVSFIAGGAHPSGIGPLGLGLAGVAVYAIVSKGQATRDGVVTYGFGAMAAGGAAIAVYVLLQRAGIEFIGWGPSTAPIGTFGNSSEAGCVMAMFAAALLWFPGISRAAGLLCAAATVATGSRTGMVALAAATTLVAVQFARPAALRVALLAAFVAASAFGWTWARRVESFQVRLGVWRGVAAMAREHPFLGVGPGRFREAFVPYRDAEEFRLSHRNDPLQYKDVADAHHAWLHVLAEQGLPAALPALLLLYVVWRRWMFFMDHQNDPANRMRLAGAGAGVIAFAVGSQAHALWASAAPAALFWFLAGACEFIGNRRPMQRPVQFGGLMAAMPVSAALLLVFCIGLLWREAAATSAMYGALRNPELREEGLEAAREWNHRDWRVHFSLGVFYEEAGRPQDAIAAFTAALREHPDHVPSRVWLGIVYARRPDTRRQATAEFERAVELAPRYYEGHYNLGVLLMGLGRRAEARAAFERALECAPGHAKSREFLEAWGR